MTTIDQLTALPPHAIILTATYDAVAASNDALHALTGAGHTVHTVFGATSDVLTDADLADLGNWAFHAIARHNLADTILIVDVDGATTADDRHAELLGRAVEHHTLTPGGDQ